MISTEPPVLPGSPMGATDDRGKRIENAILEKVAVAHGVGMAAQIELAGKEGIVKSVERAEKSMERVVSNSTLVDVIKSALPREEKEASEEAEVPKIDDEIEEGQIISRWLDASPGKASRTPKSKSLEFGQVKIMTPSRFSALNDINENGELIEQEKEREEDKGDMEKEKVENGEIYADKEDSLRDEGLYENSVTKEDGKSENEVQSPKEVQSEKEVQRKPSYSEMVERPADIPDYSRKRAMEFEDELKDQELKWVGLGRAGWTDTYLDELSDGLTPVKVEIANFHSDGPTNNPGRPKKHILNSTKFKVMHLVKGFGQ
ncbi:hypothetical protein F2Q69_00040668 [Brassica cretica]|uniref:Uncharacterized protein n=1 Tax=Brassica cretica TaxID=69181 RepID=A0A8S9ND95_BRACR|nr:hypothetical protein F2Q69_00040668 [Brassica cretica]